MARTTVRNGSHVGGGLLTAMWRDRAVVIGTVVLALGAGAAITLVQPEEYLASARVFMVDPRAEGVFSTQPAGDDTRRQQNRVERFESTAVLTRAAAMVETSMQLSELRTAVDAVPATSSDEIVVSAESSDPLLARDLANAVVAAYREEYRNEVLASAERTVAVLDAELSTLRQELAEIEEALAPYLEGGQTAQMSADPEFTMLTAQRDAQVTLIRETLLARGQHLIEARAAEDVARVEPATPPAAPRHDPVLVFSLAIAVGVAAAALLVVWREERAGHGTAWVAGGAPAPGDAVGNDRVRVKRVVMGPPRG